MDISKLDAFLEKLDPKTEPAVEVTAGSAVPLQAKTWNIDMTGICPDCGKVMEESTCLGRRILLCETDRLALPRPDNYVPPTVEMALAVRPSSLFQYGTNVADDKWN